MPTKVETVGEGERRTVDLRVGASLYERVLNIRLRPVLIAGMILVFSYARDAGAQGPKPALEPTAAALVAATAAVVETQRAGAVATQTAVAAATHTAQAEQASTVCKTAVAALQSGDPAGLNSLDAKLKAALVQDLAALPGFECLAIAKENAGYCELLSGASKDRCIKQSQLMRELKSIPPEQVKYQVLYRSCLVNSPKAECDQVREAWVSGSADSCKTLKEGWHRDFCAALVTADAEKCKGVKDAEYRGYCVAVVTEDPQKCPKEALDCPGEVQGFARVKKEGLAGFLAGLKDADPAAVAASKGAEGCAPFLTELERVCASGRSTKK